MLTNEVLRLPLFASEERARTAGSDSIVQYSSNFGEKRIDAFTLNNLLTMHITSPT